MLDGMQEFLMPTVVLSLIGLLLYFIVAKRSYQQLLDDSQMNGKKVSFQEYWMRFAGWMVFFGSLLISEIIYSFVIVSTFMEQGVMNTLTHIQYQIWSLFGLAIVLKTIVGVVFFMKYLPLYHEREKNMHLVPYAILATALVEGSGIIGLVLAFQAL